MRQRRPAFLSELPEAPGYNPIRDAITGTTDAKAAAALQFFESMPPSTGVFANPVRYQHRVVCGCEQVDLSIRSFGIRGCLLEEDIVTGAADSVRTIFVGLFARFPNIVEQRSFQRLLSHAFFKAANRALVPLANFMKVYPQATADVAMQYLATIQSMTGKAPEVRSRKAADLLLDLIDIHLENAAVGACALLMRGLLRGHRRMASTELLRKTRRILESAKKDPFKAVFTLLLQRNVNSVELRILEILGTIQIHHGSAGSNMVTRYLASLHTKSLRDIFLAGRMTLDCARHFGAITDLTEFIGYIENVPRKRQDVLIRQRALSGSLPAFGHPEISLAGRGNRMELDPRPAIYLAPLFDAIDARQIEVSARTMRSLLAAQRMYQIAFVEGIEKPGRTGRLRIAPNTDFGAWIVQEVLGIDRADRTFLSYVFRGFGWMMDVREQLQQPIIRPVIPPEPGIVPAKAETGVIRNVVDTVHERLCRANAFDFQ